MRTQALGQPIRRGPANEASYRGVDPDTGPPSLSAEPAKANRTVLQKPTVLSHEGIGRVWFLPQRGQFHQRRMTLASAPPSTGVVPLPGPPGEGAHLERRIQGTVYPQAAGHLRVRAPAPAPAPALEHAVCQRQVLLAPAAARARLAAWLPPIRSASTTRLPYQAAVEVRGRRHAWNPTSPMAWARR